MGKFANLFSGEGRNSADGAIAVSGHGVIEGDVKHAVLLPAHHYARRLGAVEHHVNAVRIRVFGIALREEVRDILRMALQKVVHVSLPGLQLYKTVARVGVAQLPKIVKINAHQADVHDRRGVGLDYKRVDREYQAADRVDYAQLDYRAHQKRYEHQRGTHVAHRFYYSGCVHDKPLIRIRSLLPIIGRLLSD